MIPAKIFKDHGCDSEALKVLFTVKTKSEKVQQLIDLMANRAKKGRERALDDYRIWAAVDFAYDVPFDQTTPTLVRHVLASCYDSDPDKYLNNVNGAVRSWGLCADDLVCRVQDKESPSGYKTYINYSGFRDLFIPIMRSYLNIRLAKIFNDLNKSPLLDYQPRYDTDLSRVRCEIITGAVQDMNSAFNYVSALRQNILNSLLYSVSLQFPYEPWYTEKQLDENGKEEIVIEGVRYTQPHVTRIGYDLQYAASTFNTDTGCKFGFYWSINRWGDVADDERYWNREEVGYGTNWLDPSRPYANYFKQVYPCMMQFPQPAPSSTMTDRETASAYYTADDADKAVFLTYMFIKIVPKDYGLGTYKYPVWFKFTIAGDDAVIYGEPWSYAPIRLVQYDADQNRARNASLALELIPSQDMISNIVNGITRAISRNLTNIVFVDEKQVNFDLVQSVFERAGTLAGKTTAFPFDSFKDRIAASQRDSAKTNCFQEFKMNPVNTAEMFQDLAVWLNLTERLIGISPQEIGSAASHQQSKYEMQVIVGNTTNRVQYTASFTDEFIEAWKKQLYEALLAHKSKQIEAQVSAEIENVEEHLKELGFTNKGKTRDGKKLLVVGNTDKLRYESFASSQNAPDVQADKESGQAMFTGLGNINNNQRLAASLDIKSLIALYELAAKKMGAGKNFDLKVDKKALAGEEVKAAIDEVAKQVADVLGNQIVKPMTDALAAQEQKIAMNEQQANQIVQVVSKLKERLDMIAAAAQSAPPLQPPTILDSNAIDPQAPPANVSQLPPPMAGPAGI